MIHLQINGQHVTAEEGETLLDVANRAGIRIPTLCHHEALEPWGGCRLCMVEITHANWRGWKGTVTACLYPVEEGLEVTTDNEAVHKVRRVVLDLLLARCPGSEVIQKLALEYGITKTSYKEAKIKSNCILCTQCVRVCKAKGADAISTGSRGADKRIAIPFKKPPPDCIGCLSCARICPTNVIQYEDKHNERRIWGRTFSMASCTSCGRPLWMTAEQVDFEANKTGLPAEELGVCPECKKQKVVKNISTTFTKQD